MIMFSSPCLNEHTSTGPMKASRMASRRFIPRERVDTNSCRMLVILMSDIKLSLSTLISSDGHPRSCRQSQHTCKAHFPATMLTNYHCMWHSEGKDWHTTSQTSTKGKREEEGARTDNRIHTTPIIFTFANNVRCSSTVRPSNNVFVCGQKPIFVFRLQVLMSSPYTTAVPEVGS